MQALDALPRDSWRALFVGDGPLREEMAGWATAYGDRVRIATGVPHDEVGAHLNAMDVLCAPSLTTPRWREQFGRMLIEAFACGTPVIASDSGEIPYVVGDAGVIAPEGDAAAWAAAIADLIESPHRRADFARRGIQRACDRFAWPCVARQHLDFFEEVLSARTESSSVCRPSLVGEA